MKDITFRLIEKNGLKKEEKVQNKKEVKEKEKEENTVGQIESRDEPIYNSFESHWILKTNSTVVFNSSKSIMGNSFLRRCGIKT